MFLYLKTYFKLYFNLLYVRKNICFLLIIRKYFFFNLLFLGIDVSTQMEHQLYEDPFVAIVIDPIRTISAGKVEIGAFRTYQKGYKAPEDEQSEYQTIPLSKIEDFGVHCKQYYSLDVSYFKSNLDKSLLDSLWNHYWVNTLSTSTLLTNADYTTGNNILYNCRKSLYYDN